MFKAVFFSGKINNEEWIQKAHLCLCIVLAWVSIAKTRRHYYATLMKETIQLGLAYMLRGLVYYHHWGSKVVYRLTCCWIRSWEFYIWICRQQENRMSHWACPELLKSQSPSPGDALRPARPHIRVVSSPNDYKGAIFFQITTCTKPHDGL